VKEGGEQKGSARGSVHWGCYYAKPQPWTLRLILNAAALACKSDFALQAVVECRALELECFRVVGLPMTFQRQ